MGELLGLGAKSGCNNMICIFFSEKKKCMKLSHLSVIMQLMMLFCVTWVIEFIWTFGDYFDMMIL